MDQRDLRAWATAGVDLWMLGTEAASVMSLRMSRIANGGVDAVEEVEMMMTEKAVAAVELQSRYMTGAIGLSPLSALQVFLELYQPKVAANNKRLRVHN